MTLSLLKPSGLMPLIFAGVGALTVLAATPQGIGFTHDSVFYWSAAVGLMEGRGISRIDGSGQPVPITHFPPLYPAALAVGARVSQASVTGVARGLAGALLGTNLALVWWLVRKATGSVLAASLTTGLVYLSPFVLERHLWAMSEPLHFVLLLATTGLLMGYLRQPNRRALIAAALVAGLAYLNRYAGLSLILSSLVALILLGPRPARRKMQDAALFAGISLLPGILWQIRNLRLTGAAANRVFGWHPIDLDKLKEAGATLASWAPVELFSLQARAVLVGLIALVIAGCSLLLLRGKSSDPAERESRSLLSVSAIHSVSYGALLLISISLFDASTRLDSRTLSPFFLLAILMATVIAWRPLASHASGLVRAAAAGIGALIAVAYGIQSADLLQNSAADGLGFSSSRWRNSGTVRLVEQIGPELLIYSNEALPVYFLSGHPAYSVPEMVDPAKDELRADFPALFGEMRRQLETGQAVLVLFEPNSLPDVLPELDQLTDGLLEAAVAQDGTIYQVAEGAGWAWGQASFRGTGWA